MSDWSQKTSATGDDGWGQPPSQPIVRDATTSIPDDWDTADDNDDASEDANKNIWEKANARPPAPEVTIASRTLGQVSQAINNPPRTILKRPTAAQSPAPTSSASAQRSLQDREASYQAARERIFGQPDPSSPEKTATPIPEPNIIRRPRGPPDVSDDQPSSPGPPTIKAGFAGRVRKQGHGRTISDLESIGDFVKTSGTGTPAPNKA